MAVSNTNMSTWQPFTGIIPSAWGDELSVTIDDKLHMTETSIDQTVQGPMIFSNTSVMTFGGPFNNTHTSASTFGGNIGFKSSTTFLGTVTHAITAARTWTFPNVTGTLALWNSNQTAVTRYWSVGGRTFANLMDENDHAFDWTWDNSNSWCDTSILSGEYCIAVHLPHGCVITALRITGQRVGNADLRAQLWRHEQASGTHYTMGQAEVTDTMGERSDTTIIQGTIDNNTYDYVLWITKSTEASEVRLRAVQIDYTVSKPLP